MTPEKRLVVTHLREQGFDFAAIDKALEMWELRPYYDGRRFIGTLMVRGPEVHAVMSPRHRGKGRISRKMVRELLAPLMERYGFLTTRSARGNGADRVLIDRLGFIKTWSDERFTYFMLTELPFGKEH